MEGMAVMAGMVAGAAATSGMETAILHLPGILATAKKVGLAVRRAQLVLYGALTAKFGVQVGAGTIRAGDGEQVGDGAPLGRGMG